MKKSLAIFTMLLALSFAAFSQSQHDGRVNPLPEDLETEFALSALPSHLQAEATVYILNPEKGFEMVRQGTNGFHTFVARTSPLFIEAPWKMVRYPTDIFIPIAFDEAGAESQMKIHFDVETMRANGMPPHKLQAIMNDRYQSGYYQAPKRAGVSYMLSPMLRVYAKPMEEDAVVSLNYPHYMFYAPNVKNEDIGGKPLSPHGFILNPGPFGYIIMPAGMHEKAAINKKYESALRRLREFDGVFSFDDETVHRPLSR